MKTNKVFNNFVGGELSPYMVARSDIPLLPKGAARCENFIVLPKGGVKFRQGSIYVKSTKGNKKAVFIPFQFNDSQSYLIEATDLKFRFYKDNSAITETPVNITGITQATPGVVTANAHGFNNGDEVSISGVGGMTQVNGRFFLVAGTTANTFQLNDIFGNAVNTTNYGVYASGGTVARVYEITSPYPEAVLEELQYAQNSDTMYIAHRSYEPRKLTRSGHTNWTLGTYARTADPFGADGSDDCPGCVMFTDTGRVMFGGTNNNPESIWASKAPSDTTTNFDDFTTGSNATDALIFTIAPVLGKVNAIQFLANTSKTMVFGTYGELRRVYGSTEEEAISPTSFTAKSVNAYGAERALPVVNGGSLFYLQRGGTIIRSLEYDIQVGGYVTVDRNVVADHLTETGVKLLTGQQGKPEIMWAVRDDGRLVGLTYKDNENISGWHRHYLGGSHVNDSSVTKRWGKVLHTGRMPRPSNVDQLWLIVERKIGANTVRSVEYISDEPLYPVVEDFFYDIDYTNELERKEQEEADAAKYRNYLYEVQKDAVHLDMAATFDGTVTTVSVTPASASEGAGVVFTASGAIFTAAMVGKEIWKKYDSNGDGGGQATITEYTDSTHVTCTITKEFDSASAITANNWIITSSVINGLDYLEGTEVNIIADGGTHANKTVTNGQVTLDQQAGKVHVGFKYNGLFELMNIDTGGITGPALSKNRNILSIAMRFLNALGVHFGATRYSLDELVFESTDDYTDRPTDLFTGTTIQMYDDRWARDQKTIIVFQNRPLPCTLLSIDAEVDTVDE